MSDAYEFALLSARLSLRKILRLLAEGDAAEAKAVTERVIAVIGRTLELEEERRRQS